MRARFPRLICAVALVFSLVALGSAQTTTGQQKTDAKKTDAKKTDAKKKDADDLKPEQVLKSLMAFFDEHDVKKDGRWGREEQVSAYGLSQVANLLKSLDKDGDGYISRAEFEDWAKKEAPEYAQEVNEARDKFEAQMERLEQAYAKASAEAKARIDRERRESRERYERFRRDRDRNRRFDRRR